MLGALRLLDSFPDMARTVLKCPECGWHKFKVYFRELVCREYDLSRPGDEWEDEAVVEVEPFIAVECCSCGADLSKYGRMLKRLAKAARNDHIGERHDA